MTTLTKMYAIAMAAMAAVSPLAPLHAAEPAKGGNLRSIRFWSRLSGRRRNGFRDDSREGISRYRPHLFSRLLARLQGFSHSLHNHIVSRWLQSESADRVSVCLKLGCATTDDECDRQKKSLIGLEAE